MAITRPPLERHFVVVDTEDGAPTPLTHPGRIGLPASRPAELLALSTERPLGTPHRQGAAKGLAKWESTGKGTSFIYVA